MPGIPPERRTSCSHDCSFDCPENAPTFGVFGHNQKRAFRHADVGRYFNFGADRDRWDAAYSDQVLTNQQQVMQKAK